MDSNEKKEFGSWVRSQRERRGMTQLDLAKSIDSAQSSIAQIELGTARSVGPKMERKLKKFFDKEEPVVSKPAVKILDQMNVTGLEHLLPALRKLGRVSIQNDFSARVNAASEAIGISKEEAAASIFLWELQKE